MLLADSPKRYIEKGDPSLDMVVGITSYGYGDDEHGQCSEYEPAIYTNVDYFHNWIIKTIKLRSKVSEIQFKTIYSHRDHTSAASKQSRKERSG